MRKPFDIIALTKALAKSTRVASVRVVIGQTPCTVNDAKIILVLPERGVGHQVRRFVRQLGLNKQQRKRLYELTDVAKDEYTGEEVKQ